ncbi:MAG: TetR/AcrR family transcriptional regulator [Desulfobulbaceae bacterium]|nr:TetR/AcrR family transcriptional regulator [Desulfobulbaceae bacterium]
MAANKKKKQTTPDSRERILQSAVRLFAGHGYGNTGLRELAAAADVNLAMINYFFGSKKALLKEILDVFFSGYLDVARKEMAGRDAVSVKLDRFIHSAVNYFAANREYLLVTIAELPHDDPEITEHKAEWGRQMVETVGKQLRAESNDTGSQNIPSVIFCSMLTSMMASKFLFMPVMEQVQPEQLEEISMEEYAGIVSRIFLQGVGDIICDKG